MILEKDYSNYKFEDKKSLLMAKVYMLLISAKDTRKFMKDYLEKDFVAGGREEEYKEFEKHIEGIVANIEDFVAPLKKVAK
jgi:hypothetical protein